MRITRMLYSLLQNKLIIKPFFVNLSHGKNVKISKKTMLVCRNGKIVLGNNIVILEYGKISTVDGGSIVINDDVFLNRNCLLYSHKSIVIGKGCILGPNVSVYDHNHLFTRGDISPNRYNCDEVMIDEGCWIGAGAIILKGVHIGKHSVIGAGCVVSQNIPEYSIVKRNKEAIIIEEIVRK